MSDINDEDNNDDEVEFIDANIADEDYVFIIGPDGELKQILLPDDLPFELPEKVNQVLAIYNVTDVENLVISPTIH
jgi:hypothetical protein